MFAGLAWGAGYLDSIPNFEFLTVLLFVGGFVLGPAWGALAGALGEFLYSAMNPYGSGLAVPLVLAAQTAGMALAGVAGGLVGWAALRSPLVRAIAVVAAGVAVTVVFDLLTNLASAVLFGPIVPTLVAALPFAGIHVGTNAALFAVVGVPLVTALERTRRSLAPAAVLVALLCAAGIGPPAALAAGMTLRSDSVAVAAEAAAAAHADSTDLVRGRRTPPPAWGDGPAALERRGDGSLSAWLTREGSMTERFAADRGSAEPLSRFGLPGSRLEIDWLGLPLTGVGAVGSGAMRAPWNAVGSVEAPRLPVSAREAYRGEVGRARFVPWAPIEGHPRVITWAAFGSPEFIKSGFFATATAGNTAGAVAVEAGGLGTLEPLGPAGDHSIAFTARHATGGLVLDAAYRSTREAAEDLAARSESRSGEAGRLGASVTTGVTTYGFAMERNDERLVAGSRLDGDVLEQTAKSARIRADVTRPLAGGDGWLAFTWGGESLESEGTVTFVQRNSTLLWGAGGWARPLDPQTRLELALGAGSAGGGGVDVAPSAMVERRVTAGTRVWLGAARGLGARLDPRAVDALDRPIEGDPPLLRTSTWLAGLGVESRSAGEENGGTVRGAWRRGERRVRGALYAGRSTPGFDVAREPLARDGAAAFEDGIEADPTQFVSLVTNASCAPVAGLRAELGGHALARRIADVVTPSDPEWRLFAELEGRTSFLQGDLDLRVGVRGELIGARAGTPAGDLPAASRLGLFAAWTLDEFEVRGEIRDVAGSNRLLPVEDPDGFPLVAETSRWVVEARWSLWD